MTATVETGSCNGRITGGQCPCAEYAETNKHPWKDCATCQHTVQVHRIPTDKPAKKGKK